MRVLQGKWEEVSRQIDLRGKHVQIVLNEQPTSPVLIRETPAAQPSAESWLQTLQHWADSHEPLNHPVDDSRDAIYGDLNP